LQKEKQREMSLAVENMREASLLWKKGGRSKEEDVHEDVLLG